MRRTFLAVAISAAVLAGACGSSGSSKTSPTTEKRTSGGSVSTALGQGVTASTIKIGVVVPDFDCFKQFVDQIRVDQDKIWAAYVDDVNQNGGVRGKKLVMDYKQYCPVPGIGVQASAMCTQFTEDDKVFALMGTFVDFTGVAHQCVTGQHHTILMTFLVDRAWMDKAPPGLLLSPQIAKERRVEVILTLLGREKTLDGKKVAILGESVTKPTVTSTLAPGLKKLGVDTGTTAILAISGSDTTQAQSQLDSFIERWKSEGVDAVFMTGQQVSSKQFVEKIRKAMPKVMLIADNGEVNGYAQDYVVNHIKPNPYEGIIGAEGETGAEHDKGDNWKTCAAIYEKHFHKAAPVWDTIIPGPGGKTIDVYNTIQDACTLTLMFHDIAAKAGTTLNNDTWSHAVADYGKIRIMDTKYASLHTGKYDADNTFRLVEFDSSIGAKGDWRQITAVQDVASGTK
jgi:major membrane immunogen (membrane-anchored lipoprotein)